MEMGDGLTTVRTVINGYTEASVRDAFTAGNLPGGEQQVTESGGILRRGCGDPWDGFARHDENVDGGLRGNVAKGDTKIVLVDDVRRDLLIAYFLEQRFVYHAVLRVSRT
jgi:hypothetical protein